jgi:surface polysaccharide O-acyltransferase-like enzyme
MKTDANRMAGIDVIRIIACLLVIGIHAIGSLEMYIPGTGFARWEAEFLSRVNCLGVPVFFAISGFCLLNRQYDSIGLFYKTRLKRILIPYLIYAIFYTAYFVGWEEKTPLLIPKEYLLRLIEGSVHPTHWFIYTILALYFITPFLSKMLLAMNDVEKRVLIFGCITFRLIVLLLELFGIEFGVKTVYFDETALLCFLIGGSARQISTIIKDKKILMVALVASFVGVVIVRESIPMYIFIFLLLQLVSDTKTEGIKRSKIISTLGMRTYSIYLIHAAVISAVLRIQTFSQKWIGIQMLLFVFEVFVISCVISFVVDGAVEKVMCLRRK